MTDKINSLIQEIALTHGVAVSRDDPIMIMQTVHDNLLKDMETAQKALLDQFREELIELNIQWNDEAEARSERVLNASLQANRQAIHDVIHETSNYLTLEIEKEMAHSISNLSNTINSSHRIATLNIIAACITLIAFILALLSITH